MKGLETVRHLPLGGQQAASRYDVTTRNQESTEKACAAPVVAIPEAATGQPALWPHSGRHDTPVGCPPRTTRSPPVT